MQRCYCCSGDVVQAFTRVPCKHPSLDQITGATTRRSFEASVALDETAKHTSCHAAFVTNTDTHTEREREREREVQRNELSLLQAVNPSGEGSATRVLLLHSARFPVSYTVSHKSSMLYLTTSVHLFLCLPRLRCPLASASRIRLTQSSARTESLDRKPHSEVRTTLSLSLSPSGCESLW